VLGLFEQKSGRESRLLNVVGFVGESQPTRMCLYMPQEKNAGLSSGRTHVASSYKEMEGLPALAKELGYPSANKLFEAAQRAGVKVTLKQVTAFVASQNVRQVFHKPPPEQGQNCRP
jgi:hypothetical protein